jgi:HEAT repeats
MVERERQALSDAETRLRAAQGALESVPDDPMADALLDFSNALRRALSGIDTVGSMARERRAGQDLRTVCDLGGRRQGHPRRAGAAPERVQRMLESATWPFDADPRVFVLGAAASALVERGWWTPGLHPRAQPPIQPNPLSGRARSQAARALGATTSWEAVEALIDALQDEPGEVRASAARAVGAVGDPIAAGPLRAARSDTDDRVRAAASGALDRLGVVTTAAAMARGHAAGMSRAEGPQPGRRVRRVALVMGRLLRAGVGSLRGSKPQPHCPGKTQVSIVPARQSRPNGTVVAS